MLDVAMDGDDGDHEKYVRALPKFNDWFHARPVKSKEVWIARWRPELGRVTYREGGVIGTVEVEGVHHRVHVCANVPCTRVHNDSKQKAGVLPPVHVRLMDPGIWPPYASGHEPAVAGGESLAGDATPPLVPPIDAPVLPPSPPPTPAPTPLPTTTTDASSDTTCYTRGE